MPVCCVDHRPARAKRTAQGFSLGAWRPTRMPYKGDPRDWCLVESSCIRRGVTKDNRPQWLIEDPFRSLLQGGLRSGPRPRPKGPRLFCLTFSGRADIARRASFLAFSKQQLSLAPFRPSILPA
jgi:hypothetical protein